MTFRTNIEAWLTCPNCRSEDVQFKDGRETKAICHNCGLEEGDDLPPYKQ